MIWRLLTTVACSTSVLLPAPSNWAVVRKRLRLKVHGNGRSEPSRLVVDTLLLLFILCYVGKLSISKSLAAARLIPSLNLHWLGIVIALLRLLGGDVLDITFSKTLSVRLVKFLHDLLLPGRLRCGPLLHHDHRLFNAAHAWLLGAPHRCFLSTLKRG